MTSPEGESRPLTISDLAVAQEAEIIKNPYQFLNLPENIPFANVRRAFIGLAKTYHPDLWNPRTLGLPQVEQAFSVKDLSSHGVSLKSIKKLIEDLSSADSEEDKKELERLEQKARTLETLQQMAHEKMVLLNRAYQEIKSRISPSEWKTLAGYDLKTVYEDDGRVSHKMIELEGYGEIYIFPNHEKWWVAGPNLSFDWGPPPYHPWYEDEFRHQINLKHLFAHFEFEKGQQPNRALLEPFFDCFRIDEAKAEQLIYMLVQGENRPAAIMESLNIHQLVEVHTSTVDERHLYLLRFTRQLNEIINLSRSVDGLGCPGEEEKIEAQITDDGRLILKESQETVFSETDYILFLTLAYGPLLR